MDPYAGVITLILIVVLASLDIFLLFSEKFKDRIRYKKTNGKTWMSWILVVGYVLTISAFSIAFATKPDDENNKTGTWETEDKRTFIAVDLTYVILLCFAQIFAVFNLKNMERAVLPYAGCLHLGATVILFTSKLYLAGSLHAIGTLLIFGIDGVALPIISASLDTSGKTPTGLTRSPRQKIHFICGVYHLLSSAVIFSASYASADGKMNIYERMISAFLGEITTWTSRCYNETSKTYGPDNEICEDEDKMFRSNPPESLLGKTNVVYMAMSFAFWSGTVHLYAALSPFTDESSFLTKVYNKESLLRFVGDYSITAPIMLSLTNALWGAANLGGVVFGPILLFFMLIASAQLLLKPPFSRHWQEYLRFACLCVAYGLAVFYPIIDAVTYITTPDESSNKATAPNVVKVVAGTLLVTFSSFIFPYTLQLFESPLENTWLAKKLGLDILRENNESDTIFIIYAALSLIAKTSLHASLGTLSVLQTQALKNDITKPPPSSLQNGSAAIAATGTSVTIGVIIWYFMRKWLKKQRSSK